MRDISLITDTGHSSVDDMLKSIIATFEENFPQRIRGYYIEGSYANGSQVTTSDVDLLLIFKDAFISEQERAKAEGLARQYNALPGVPMDVRLCEEAHLRAVGLRPALKMGSMVIYGEDIREHWPLMPLSEWTRDCMHTSYWRMATLCASPSSVSYPLAYPDPAGEFYGYDQHKWRLADGTEVNCLRDLVHLVGWAATAILALQAGRYVARKSDCQRLYTDYIADEWTALLYDTYTLCRGRWHYLLPEEQGERRLVRLICSRTPAFENHFLLLYKEFLLHELQSSEKQGKLQALGALRKVPYKDREVEDAIGILENDRDGDIREGVAETQRAYQQHR